MFNPRNIFETKDNRPHVVCIVEKKSNLKFDTNILVLISETKKDAKLDNTTDSSNASQLTKPVGIDV